MLHPVLASFDESFSVHCGVQTSVLDHAGSQQVISESPVAAITASTLYCRLQLPNLLGSRTVKPLSEPLLELLVVELGVVGRLHKGTIDGYRL